MHLLDHSRLDENSERKQVMNAVVDVKDFPCITL